jgi:hypothetical protein
MENETKEIRILLYSILIALNIWLMLATQGG